MPASGAPLTPNRKGRDVAMPRYESPYDPSTMPKGLEHIRYEKKGPRRLCDDRPARGAERAPLLFLRRAPACWRDMALDPGIYVGIVTARARPSAPADVKFLAKYQTEGKRTPHEDPNNPLYHWGGGGSRATPTWRSRSSPPSTDLPSGVGLSLALQCQLR